MAGRSNIADSFTETLFWGYRRYDIQLKALGVILHVAHHAESMSTILNCDVMCLLIFQFCNEIEYFGFWVLGAVFLVVVLGFFFYISLSFSHYILDADSLKDIFWIDVVQLQIQFKEGFLILKQH